MSADDNFDSLEKARKRLYAPNKKPIFMEDTLSMRNATKEQHNWQSEKPSLNIQKPHKHVRIALIFFWAALIFFIIATSSAAYLFLSGDRSVSINNVSVTMKGPTTIAGGDTVSLLLSVTNSNPAPIENVNMTLRFPTGTRSAVDMLTPLTNDTENLGTIAAGGSIERTVKVVLFGGQGDILTIPATLHFKTAGSNAVFVKHTSYAISVIATPLSVSVDAAPQTVPGQPFSLTATVRSNATKPIAGVVLRVDYPTGFVPTKTSISPVGTTFVLGTLAPGTTSIVHIIGTLAGQNGEQRAFRFTVGTADSASGTAIAVTYMTQTATVDITKPFLATTLNVNGSSASHTVITAQSHTSVSLVWVNTLKVPITNANIIVALSGAALDPSSVRVVRGQYQSSNQTIVFSRDTDASLAMLSPGAQGVGTFTFSTLPLTNTASTSATGSPTITISVSVSGQRPGQGNVPETVTSSVTKTIKVATTLSLEAYATHSTGPFTNTGPIPPTPNQMTTYTIIWNAHNTTSDIAAATISANLPADVKFIGPTSSTNNQVVYNSGEHSLKWTIGNLAAGASRQTDFQVSFVPSTSQHGYAPVLVNPATFSAFDRFAQVTVSVTTNAVTTSLLHDSSYPAGSGTVQ